MKLPELIAGLALSLGGLLLGSGCATTDLNPKTARENTGYVDFYTDSAPDAYWQVWRRDEGSQEFKEIRAELRTAPHGILRVAVQPGRQVFRVSFLNKVVTKPWEGEVEVWDGKITPVKVDLAPSGEAVVQGYREVTRYKLTRVKKDAQTSYRIEAVSGSAVPYQRKESMPYPAAH